MTCTYLRDRLVYRCRDKDKRMKPWARFGTAPLYMQRTRCLPTVYAFGIKSRGVIGQARRRSARRGCTGCIQVRARKPLGTSMARFPGIGEMSASNGTLTSDLSSC